MNAVEQATCQADITLRCICSVRIANGPGCNGLPHRAAPTLSCPMGQHIFRLLSLSCQQHHNDSDHQCRHDQKHNGYLQTCEERRTVRMTSPGCYAGGFGTAYNLRGIAEAISRRFALSPYLYGNDFVASKTWPTVARVRLGDDHRTQNADGLSTIRVSEIIQLRRNWPTFSSGSDRFCKGLRRAHRCSRLVPG